MVDFQQLETYLSVSAATIYAESCDKLLANLEEILWFCGLLTFHSHKLPTGIHLFLPVSYASK